MDEEPIAIDFDRPVPLFPLPDCVLLPYAVAPLHIFEPRYRQLMVDMLQSQRMLMAMAVFQGDQWKLDYQGHPPLRPYACLAYVARHGQQEEGRYNLLLQGLCRVKLLEEVPSDPYRQALVVPLEDPLLEPDLERPIRQAIGLMNDPLIAALSQVIAARRWAERGVAPAALLDIFCHHLADPSDERYQLLAEADVAARVAWLLGRLGQLARTMRHAQRLSPDEDAAASQN